MVYQIRILDLVLVAGFCLLASTRCHGQSIQDGRMNEADCKVMVQWLASVSVTNKWWNQDNACSPPPVCADIQSTVKCNDEGHVISASLGGIGFFYAPPAQWWKLTYLQTLDLHQTGLIGTIPEQWGQLQNLTSLDLSGNSNLRGSLPESWGRSMQQLQELRLSDTGLDGQWKWSQFDEMSVLELTGTQINSSSLTPWVGYLCTLDLRYNILLPNATVIDNNSNQICPSQKKLRKTIAWIIIGIFLLLLLCTFVWYCKPDNSNDCCCSWPSCSCVYSVLMWTKNALEHLPVIGVYADLASDFWVLIQVRPQYENSALWPFYVLLPGLLLPNLLVSFHWCYNTITTEGQRTHWVTVWLAIFFCGPFIVWLHFFYLLPVAVVALWHILSYCPPARPPASPAASQPAIQTDSRPVTVRGCCCISQDAIKVAQKYGQLLSLLMVVPESLLSAVVMTVFFVVNKRRVGQVLSPAAYGFSMSTSCLHILLELRHMLIGMKEETRGEMGNGGNWRTRNALKKFLKKVFTIKMT